MNNFFSLNRMTIKIIVVSSLKECGTMKKAVLQSVWRLPLFSIAISYQSTTKKHRKLRMQAMRTDVRIH